MRILLALALISSAGAFAPAAGAGHRLLAARSPGIMQPTVVMQQPTVAEKSAAAAPYLLPILDGFQYGFYVYNNVPPLGAVAGAVLPGVAAFQSLPFGGLILFIGMSVFTRNPGLPRYVRFNIQQALLLDIIMILPGFFEPVSRMMPGEIQAMGSNFVFYLWVLVVGYSWTQIALGRNPNQVPILSEAAEMQIGPM